MQEVLLYIYCILLKPRAMWGKETLGLEGDTIAPEIWGTIDSTKKGEHFNTLI